MNENFKITCPSCEKFFENYSAANKHIETCEKYENWKKNYIPQKFTCENCKMQFANNEYLISHESKCKNKNNT